MTEREQRRLVSHKIAVLQHAEQVVAVVKMEPTMSAGPLRAETSRHLPSAECPHPVL